MKDKKRDYLPMFCNDKNSNHRTKNIFISIQTIQFLFKTCSITSYLVIYITFRAALTHNYCYLI